MRTSVIWMAALLVGAALGADDKTRRVTFTKDSLGKMPPGWKSDHTGKDGAGVWKVVADATAPSKTGHVLAQTGTSPNLAFNLCVTDGPRQADVEVAVMFKANRGKKDQGGGVVWRYIDPRNYYIARYNPLEDNFRLYKIVEGKRIQLATKEAIALPAGQWHHLGIRMVGDKIECFLAGKKELEAKDSTFKNAGKVGLWTKADAQTSFDQFVIREMDTARP